MHVYEFPLNLLEEKYSRRRPRSGENQPSCYNRFRVKSVFGISVQIDNDNLQELQVISGTFNAEYGPLAFLILGL